VHHSIEVENLSFSYPDGHPALREVSLTIAPGEKAALVGPNGAGKSTLILHLNGILSAPVPPWTVRQDRQAQVTGTGLVRVCGLPVEQKNLSRVRAAVGLVFQNPDDQLFSPTVYDDVAFGPLYQGLRQDEINTRVDEALTAVRMKEYASRVSHHLSMGEKKRIAIATVLSMRPEVLALDEPTADLDPRSRRMLINLLREMPITMLASTHDMRMVQELFPRMVIMDAGCIVADGATTHLLSDEVLLEMHGLEKP
jgi:cobalt/nickel transport system ATP-binding protein